MNDIDDLSDDDIPDSAFSGPAPAREAKESKGGGPDGPPCPDGCRDDGRPQKMWRNETRNGKPYFRCGSCKGCWSPLRDDKTKVDAASKWPPLPAGGAK